MYNESNILLENNMDQHSGTKANYVKTEAVSNNGMVATKDKLSTEAGLEILKLGGNAVDAGIAACLAVGVVEPESSGIGGGGYMTFQVGEQGGVIGFPMKGPLNGTPEMYELTGESSVGSFGWAGVKNNENIHGYKSIAVPGCIAGLLEAHKRFGKIPLSEVVSPAVKLARDGFYPEWFTLYKFASLTEMLLRYEELGKTFMPSGILPFGGIDGPYTLKQKNLANTLEVIGKNGLDGFYRSEITENIVNDIQNNGGILTMEDFDQYKPFFWDKGLEFKYRDKIIRVPKYACAGITSAMTMKTLNGFDLSRLDHNSSEMLHLYISSARMAYADRFKYVADPEFADVPWNGMISDKYIEKRQKEIKDTAPSTFKAGNPWIEEGRDPKFVLESSQPRPDSGTTHLGVIDKDGNAVSITNTIMSGFGSGIIPKNTGVVMNNGMMWYDPTPNRVNSIASGKFPLNNMTPALVIGKDGVEISVGASGGRRITNCVTSLLVKMIDYKMSPQKAIDEPRVDCSSMTTDVSPELDINVIKELTDKGHKMRVLGEGFTQTGFAKFASPIAITKHGNEFRAGVDTFHAAHAEGMSK
tara:strand:- start:3116 stop:4870 length:1755 start_codon:yes stop_codon:yes gene_type:complete